MSDTVSLRDYIERRFQDQEIAVTAALSSAEKAVNAALVAAQTAVAKAETASEKRFDAVNEFRQTLSDQTATFIPRAEADIKFDAMTKEIDELKSSRDTISGANHGSAVTVGKIIAIIGVSITVMTFIISLVVLMANRVV